MTDIETTETTQLIDGTVVPFLPPIPAELLGESIGQVVSDSGLFLEDLGGALDFDQFQVLGKWVQLTASGGPWWEGDWANYGEAMFGDQYLQAIEMEWSDPTMHAKRRNVAGEWDREDREAYPTLSFEHFLIVTEKLRKGTHEKLLVERKSWLNVAVRDGLTPALLAAEIKKSEAIDVDEVPEEADSKAAGPISHKTFTLSITVADSFDTAEEVMKSVEREASASLEANGVTVSKATQSISQK